MEMFLAVLWLGTAIWVWADASQIGMRKGLIDGFGDAGPFFWFLAVLLLWIVFFPYYIAKRPAIKEAAKRANGPHGGSKYRRRPTYYK